MIIIPNAMEATISNSNTPLNHIPMLLQDAGTINKIFFALTSWISADIVEEKEVYCIHHLGTQYTIEKEQGLLLKQSSGKTQIDGVSYDSFIEYKNWSFDSVTDDELVRPNLTGYEIIHN